MFKILNKYETRRNNIFIYGMFHILCTYVGHTKTFESNYSFGWQAWHFFCFLLVGNFVIVGRSWSGCIPHLLEASPRFWHVICNKGMPSNMMHFFHIITTKIWSYVAYQLTCYIYHSGFYPKKIPLNSLKTKKAFKF